MNKKENIAFYTEKCGFHIASTVKGGNVELALLTTEKINEKLTLVFYRKD